jgi:hypothetical protein
MAANDPNLPVPAADEFVALAGFRRKTRAQLIGLIEQMAQDWQTLNLIHNRRAEGNGWCPEYEDNQRNHNRKLMVLQLYGRGDARLKSKPGLRTNGHVGTYEAQL